MTLFVGINRLFCHLQYLEYCTEKLEKILYNVFFRVITLGNLVTAIKECERTVNLLTFSMFCLQNNLER